MSELRVFADEKNLFATAAAAVAAASSEAIAARGYFTCGVSGGSSAKGLFPVLAARDLVDWVRTKIWWVDERAVPPDHPDSNYKLACDLLLDRVPLPKDHVFRMRADDPDLDWAASDYAKTLPERFDLLVLGMGPDGHCCSLFPGFPQLGETERLVVPVDGSPKPPPRRMTVTPPVLEAARSILMIASGAEKADAVARAMAPEGDVHATPARLARRGTWLVMQDAASKLPG